MQRRRSLVAGLHPPHQRSVDLGGLGVREGPGERLMQLPASAAASALVSSMSSSARARRSFREVCPQDLGQRVNVLPRNVLGADADWGDNNAAPAPGPHIFRLTSTSRGSQVGLRGGRTHTRGRTPHRR